jgi:DNA-binding HxlR family transcriptional regulator
VRWNDIGEARCSVARALSVVGDRWTLLLIREAFLRTRRFEDFQLHTGASRAIVADRLRQLVDDGVLERVQYHEHPVRHEYRLTEKGRDLYPVVVGLLAWGNRWNPAPEGPSVTLTHRACGHEAVPQLSCPHCGDRLGARDMVADVRRPTT